MIKNERTNNLSIRRIGQRWEATRAPRWTRRPQAGVGSDHHPGMPTCGFDPNAINPNSLKPESTLTPERRSDISVEPAQLRSRITSMNNQTDQQQPKPGLSSEFLEECASYLGVVHGAGTMVGFSGRYDETLHLPWWPNVKEGMPAYDVRSWAWEFVVAADGDYNSSVEIKADGRVSIFEGGDLQPSVYLDLVLKHPFEMGELLELIEQLTPDNCKRASFQAMPSSSIIQEIFVLIPGDTEQRLAKFSWSSWEAKCPELLNPFKVFYLGELNKLDQMEYSTWREWLERKVGLDRITFAGPLLETDLVFCPGNGFQSARANLRHYRRDLDLAPRLVIRLRPQQSRMYFLDFLEHTEEGKPLWEGLRGDPAKLPQLLNQTNVKYPTDRLMQIRLGTELRVARHAYQKKIRSLMKQREPAEKLQEFYRLRHKHVQLLHTDYLSQIEAMQDPLPFLVEWPLHRFQRMDDRLSKIKYGQQLLNILVKLPLFLALEELRSEPEHRPAIEPIEAQFLIKPASDGTILSCLRQLDRLIKEKEIVLRWFGRLLEQFIAEGEPGMNRLIQARNEFHHAPFDEVAMLRTLDIEIPSLIKMFRNALRGVLFVSPEHQNQEGGKHVVVARNLMGYDGDFRREKYVTTAPYEMFPSGEIVAVKGDFSEALPLTQFFKSQPIRTVSLDVGVFDKMVKGHPAYTFVRDLGGELP